MRGDIFQVFPVAQGYLDASSLFDGKDLEGDTEAQDIFLQNMGKYNQYNRAFTSTCCVGYGRAAY